MVAQLATGVQIVHLNVCVDTLLLGLCIAIPSSAFNRFSRNDFRAHIKTATRNTIKRKFSASTMTREEISPEKKPKLIRKAYVTSGKKSLYLCNLIFCRS